MTDRFVVSKCANRSEVDDVSSALQAGGFTPYLEELNVLVASEELEGALDLLAQMPQAPRPRYVSRKHESIEWTGRCPACGSMKISPIEHGGLAAATVVLLALWGLAYAGARQMHLRHPVIDTLALAPLMLFASWLVFRRTPNARCEACHTYWKARH